MPSHEYLEELWQQAKKVLPGWQYAMLWRHAQPVAGGRAAHRVDEPTFLEKMALEEITPAALRKISDEEIEMVWLRLNQWFVNAQRRKQAVENVVNAALWTMRELARREKKVEENALTEAVSRLESVHKERQQSVRGTRGEIPKHLEKILRQGPGDITLVRDFVAVAGSAAVAEAPADVDVVVRAPYDAKAGTYGLDGAALWVALRRFLAPDKDGPQIQLIGSPAGSFTDYVPVFDLVARRREPEVVKIESEPPRYAGKGKVIKAIPAGPAEPDEMFPDVPTCGPVGAQVAFIGASPSRLDVARQEYFVGPVGKTFNDVYLRPLGLRRDDVLLLNLVPKPLTDKRGKPREPVEQEITEWRGWLDSEIKKFKPRVVIALGKAAQAALASADVSLPHPSAVRRFGDSGEVGRKLKRVQILMAERGIAKQDEEDTREEVAVENWNEHWQEMLPRSGGGRFVYQHHWRGLPKEDVGKDDAELMRQTDHSVHGDLRLEGNDALWGFTIFLGEAKDNRGPNLDKLIDWKKDDNLQVTPKLSQPEPWLSVGQGKPHVSEPGGVGATSETSAKFFERDHGKYQLGVARLHMVEIFLDGKDLSGRYLFTFAPVAGGRRWLIEKPDDQKPMAETRDLADVLGELKQKGQKFLFWAKPGMRPILYDVQSGREVERKSESAVRILKADPIKRIVYGVVLDPYGNRGQPETDAHNDWTPPAAVEKSAHDYLKNSRVVGLQHAKKASAAVVESWVEPYPTRNDYLLAMQEKDHAIYRRPYGDDFIHSGSWLLGVELGPNEWADYENGKFNAFSPGGYGSREPLRAMPNVRIIELKAATNA